MNQQNPLAKLDSTIAKALADLETHSQYKVEAESELEDLLKQIESKKSEIQNLQETIDINRTMAENMKARRLRVIEASERLKELGPDAYTAIELAGIKLPPETTPETDPMTATAITPPASTASTAPTDDEALIIIKALDVEHMTDNYLPIYLYRAALPQLTRKEQDHILYRLAAVDCIELSALQEVRAYTDEQIKSGIPQDIGGRLFFIMVTDVGATAVDIALMNFNQLKTYYLETLGLSKDDVRKHGHLTRRKTWIDAIKSVS